MPLLLIQHPFLPTPSARRATGTVGGKFFASKISTHALREEGDSGRSQAVLQRRISTHALREEGDQVSAGTRAPAEKFLPTPSARRATIAGHTVKSHIQFLPTPSARRATGAVIENTQPFGFLPTPSARRATSSLSSSSQINAFLPTPSARRATRSPLDD